MSNSNEIYRDGVRYILSRVAAKEVSFVPDYVSRMCREGQVRGIRHAGNWYVDTESLAAFIKSQAQEYEVFKQRKAAEGKALLSKSLTTTDALNSRSRTFIEEIESVRAGGSLKSLRTLQVASAALALFVVVGALNLGFQRGMNLRNDSAFAAASLPVIDPIARSLFNALCPIFNSCAATPTPTFIAETPKVHESAKPVTVQTQESGTKPSTAATPTPIQNINNITQPIRERIIERVVAGQTPVSFVGITLAQLSDAESRLNARINSLGFGGAQIAPSIAAAGNTVIYTSSPAAQRIDNLEGVTIRNATIIGGSISGTSGIGGGTTTSAPEAGRTFEVSGDYLAPTTTLTVLFPGGFVATASSTLSDVQITNATSTSLYTTSLSVGSATGVLTAASGFVSALAYGSDGQVLKLSGGVPTWAADQTGSGGGASAWATTTDSLAVYPANAASVILVGASATSTTGNIFEVKGNSLLRGNVTAYNTVQAPYFTATSSNASQLPYASTTAISAVSASTTNLVISSVSGGILKTDARGLVSLASAGIDFLPVSTTLFSTSSAQYLLANSNIFSTTSNNYWKSQNNFFSTTSADYYITQANISGFSTTSADFWSSLRSFFSTTSAQYFLAQNQGAAFSSTSANYLLATYDKGFFFSTTSNDYWRSANNFFSTTSASFWAGGVNFFSTTSVQYLLANTNLFSTSSTDFFVSQRSFFSTTSAQYLLSVSSLFSTTSNDYWQSQRNFFSTSSASYFLAQNQGASFSTTSAIYFADASTTIAKTYANNTFTGTQTFQNASTTNISALYASSTAGFFGTLSIGSLTGFLKATAGTIASALVNLAADVTGILPVANGGTGWASLAAGAIPYGNGSSALATTTTGLPGQVLALLGGAPTWIATTTFSSGLAYSNGNVTFSAPTATSLTIPYASTTALTATMASTSNLYLGNLSNTILKANISGLVTAAVAGVDYSTSTFSYPFVGNATSSLLTFSNGLLAYSSSTIGNGSAGGGLTVNGTATTTNLVLTSAAGSAGCATFAINGLLSNTGVACGSGGGASFPFTPGIAFAANVNATSTALQLQGGLFASSSIRFGNASVSGFLFDSTTGNLGLGTTTPGSIFSIQNIANFTSGTSTIYNNFNVQGQLKVGGSSIYLNGSATSTFSQGIDLGSGCFSVGGTCVGSGSAGGSGGGQLLAVYASSTVGTSSINFNGASGSQPSFSNGVLTLPSNTSHIVVEIWGGGGGGGGGNSSNNGIAGGVSTFGNGTGSGLATTTALGGAGGQSNDDGGAGGTATNGDINLSGSGGMGLTCAGGAISLYATASGGSAPRGGGGGAGVRGATAGAGGAYGGGGGGGGVEAGGANACSSGGGGGGAYALKLVPSVSGTYYYNVGSGGSGGAGSGAGQAGGAGGAGGIVISVYTTGISNGSLGSGTAGQFAFYNAAGTNLSATSSIFLDTNSRVGIGTTSPGSTLSINGNQYISGSITSGSAIASVLPYASTTAITATNASTTNLIVSGAGGTAGCATFAANGLLSNTGVACGSGGSSFSYLFPSNATTTLLNFNGGLTWTAATGTSLFANTLTASQTAFGATGTTTITSTGALGVGTSTPWGQLSVQSSSAEALFVSGGGLLTANLESNPLTIRYSNRIFPQAVAGATESTGMYMKVDPTGVANNLFGIYGEVTSNQEDTEGGFIKTVHFGQGDAIYNAIFNTGIGVESALFANGGRGFLGSLQETAGANAIPFVSLWSSSTIPGYGQFYASESPARALTIQKFAASAPDGYEQIRLTESDLSRNRFAVYNSGSTYISSLAATSGAPLLNSPDLVLQGSNHYYGLGTSDMNAIIRNVTTGTSTNEFRFMLGTSSQESIAAILRKNQLDMQSNSIVGIGGLTYSNGSVLTLSGSAAINQNLQTVDTPTFAGVLATGSSTLQNFTFVNASGTSATTTSLFTGTASTTRFYGSQLSTCQTGFFLTWNSGSFGCSADQIGGGGASFPFTSGTAFSTNVNATTTALQLQGGLFASSTIRFGNSGISGFLFDSSTGYLGLGTTSPSRTLSVSGEIIATRVSAYGAGLIPSNIALGDMSLASNVSGSRNTAIGYQALFSATSSDSNTAIGYQALYNSENDGVNGASDFRSYRNTAIGDSALFSNQGGSFNTAIGYNSLYFNTTGTSSVAVGNLALFNNTTGWSNTGVGNSALGANTSGYFNTGLGNAAGEAITTGFRNVAVGHGALRTATSSNNMVAVGQSALMYNTWGTFNTALGSSALMQNTTGGSNLAAGFNAMTANLTGSYNTVLGINALSTATAGSENTILGYRALASGTGSNNIAIGSQTGDNLSSGSGNILIGYGVDAPNASGDNQLSIGNLIFGTGVDGSNTTLATGKIGIGTSTPWQLLSVAGTIASNAILPNGPYTDNLSLFDLGTSTARWNALWAGTVNIGTSTFSLMSDSRSNLGIFTSANGAGTQAFTFTSNGRFGIGTTSPGSILSVAGNTLFGGNVTATGTLTLGTALSVANGGTGATDAATARSNLGVGSGLTGTNTMTVTPWGYCNGSYGGGGSFSYTNGVITSSSNMTVYLPDTGSCDGDIAEDYGTEETVIRGEIVGLGTQTSSRIFKIAVPTLEESTSTTYTITTSRVRKATFVDRNRIIGAIPTTPFKIGGDEINASENPMPVALVGHVPVRMTLDGGDVHIGDPITVSSSTPGWGMKALTSGRIIGYALEDFDATATSSDGMIEIFIKAQDWVAPDSLASALANITLQDLAATSTNPVAASFFAALFTRITDWLGDSTNGIAKIFANEIVATNVTADTLTATQKLCVGTTCVTESQLQALLAGAAAPVGAGSPPSGSPATLTINGNNPTQWQLNTPWQDNLGALFTHSGQSETIYSTSTVDTTLAGTTTIDYWATVPTSGEVIHATRSVVVPEEQVIVPEVPETGSSTPPTP